MPIVIPKSLPAYATLVKENVFVMESHRAKTQDIRPIEILIVNLMPTKIETETQLLRLLSNSPLQVNVTFLSMQSYQSENVSSDHLKQFYTHFSAIKNRHFDGAIITGAPIEHLAYESVKYWDEICQIFEYCRRSVTSTLNICWGAQASLYYFYGVRKSLRPKKLFGVYENIRQDHFDGLLKGFDDLFKIPFSCYTRISEKDVQGNDQLEVLSYGQRNGSSILKSKDNKNVYILGHLEYDRDTLELEYQRDLKKGLATKAPEHYYRKGTPAIPFQWQSSANLLFVNWLNYYVYQVTPY